MSYDLAVWLPRKLLSHDEAHAVYVKLCAGLPSALPPSPAVHAFYQELTAAFPELDSNGSDADDSVWSCRIDRSPGHVVLCCGWAHRDAVHALARSLARKYDLLLYDPQQGRALYPPQSPFSKDVARLPWPAIVNELTRLMRRQSDDAFVIIEDRNSGRFVQFGHGPHLTLDLPAGSLRPDEIARATDQIRRWGGRLRPVRAPDASDAPREHATFEADFGTDATRASEAALTVFSDIFCIEDPDFVITTN